MKIIPRPFYIDKIENWFNRNTIIILTGQRRVGKSYLLRLVREKYIHNRGYNIIFIDKEKKEYDEIKKYEDLNQYIDNKKVSGKRNIILIDEIQDIEGFEKSLRSWYEEEDVEIVVTGSNSKILSSELSTLIGGRYKEIYIQSLNYKEFLIFHNVEDSDESLKKFMRSGGLPGLMKIGLNDNDVIEYQNDVLNTVLMKDVILRNDIRNVAFLQNLINYLADNTGKLISASNIAKYMKSNSNPVSVGVILNYLRYLSESFIIRKVPRYDIHGKRLFENNEKYYFQDIGIRNTLIQNNRAFDIEKQIENIVYNELVFQGYNITVGQLSGKEVDFIAQKKGEEPHYIQVTYLLASEETREREFGNLKLIHNNYPKYVISLDPYNDSSDYDGIKHLSLRHFLIHGL
ncbi:MAG: ATP-binding protein [Muribaculaceae bacterium]|nr:ATP-binding protein [Muribaculaceae bacterium]